eukprot:SAG31_NODE_188_length_20842_cov_31.993444_12_plen_138_part_00
MLVSHAAEQSIIKSWSWALLIIIKCLDQIHLGLSTISHYILSVFPHRCPIFKPRSAKRFREALQTVSTELGECAATIGHAATVAAARPPAHLSKGSALTYILCEYKQGPGPGPAGHMHPAPVNDLSTQARGIPAGTI